MDHPFKKGDWVEFVGKGYFSGHRYRVVSSRRAGKEYGDWGWGERIIIVEPRPDVYPDDLLGEGSFFYVRDNFKRVKGP